MSVPLAWDVYAQLLASKGHGYPLWYPEGYKGRTPQIGDVGHIYNGQFIPLFNVTRSVNDQHFRGSQPVDYEPLVYDKEMLLNVKEHAIQTKYISSKSVVQTNASGNIAVDGGIAGAGASYEYKCASEKGALLLLKEDVTQEEVVTNAPFPAYMKKHHNSWSKWATEDGLVIKPERLILVRGTGKTTEWTVVAFQSDAGRHSAGIQVTFVPTGSIGLELSRDTQSDRSVDYRSGPKNTTSDSGHAPLQVTGSAENGTITHQADSKYNQCVFMPHYRLKRRLGIITRIQAAAGHDELPPPGDGDSATQITIETDDRESRSSDVPADFSGDAVDTLLDYILEHSDADIAVACEADVNALLIDGDQPHREWPEDMITWLQVREPKIDVEDGLGTISLVEAIQKARHAELSRMVNSAKAGAAESAQGDASITGRGDDEDDERLTEYPEAKYMKNIIGEGKLLRGKYLPETSIILWPHLTLTGIEPEGGTSAVTSMALSPDGQFLATSYQDSIHVWLWHINAGRLVRKWQGHQDAVSSVSYSPDGRQIASGSADTNIILWSPDTNNEVGRLEGADGHGEGVCVVCFSPNGRQLASGSLDNTIKIWDTESKTLLYSLAEHASQISHLAFVRDGTRLVSCADITVCVWQVDSDTVQLLCKLEGHTDTIWSMALSQEGDRIITGSEDHTARIWESATGNELVTLYEHTGPVWAVCFSPDGSEIISGSYDTTLIASDSFSGQQRIAFTDRPSEITSVAYSGDGKYIVSGSADGEVKLWSHAEGRLIAEYQGHEEKVGNIIFTRDNRSVLSCSNDGSVRMWSVQDALRID